MKVTRRMTQSPEARAAILAQAQAMGISVEDFDTIERGERTMTHTPGPWRVCQMEVTNRGKMWGINGDEGTSGLSGDARLAEVFSIEANAKLVAAAPELLAALKEARTSLSRTRSAFTANGGLMSAIDAAIAKATE